MQVRNGRSSARCFSPSTNTPPAPAQAGQQAQQQQHQQYHVAPQVKAPATQQQGQQVGTFKLVLF